jgi:hypothetical protein
MIRRSLLAPMRTNRFGRKAWAGDFRYTIRIGYLLWPGALPLLPWLSGLLPLLPEPLPLPWLSPLLPGLVAAGELVVVVCVGVVAVGVDGFGGQGPIVSWCLR